MMRAHAVGLAQRVALRCHVLPHPPPARSNRQPTSPPAPLPTNGACSVCWAMLASAHPRHGPQRTRLPLNGICIDVVRLLRTYHHRSRAGSRRGAAAETGRGSAAPKHVLGGVNAVDERVEAGDAPDDQELEPQEDELVEGERGHGAAGE